MSHCEKWLSRFYTIFGHMGNMIANRYYPPDIAYVLDKRYLRYVLVPRKLEWLGRVFPFILGIRPFDQRLY
jgi:hypothetical protein